MAGLATEQGIDKMVGSMFGLMDGDVADQMADCLCDDLAGLMTDREMDGRDCLMVGMMHGEVADWWDE